jgi:hypothetical protein
MNRLLKSAILSTAVLATTLAALPGAQAGERWRDSYRVERHHHSSRGDLAVAGILGLAAGALAVGLTSRQPVYQEPVYDNPYRRPRPQPIREYYPREVDAYGSLEPWSRAWYQYCVDRYRSFDARSGTFMGYDGQRHFCVAD